MPTMLVFFSRFKVSLIIIINIIIADINIAISTFSIISLSTFLCYYEL